VEVIPMSSTAKDLYLNLVKKAEKEIIIMFPTTNAFIRQKNIRVIQFSEEAARERNVKVRILMPSHKSTEDAVRQLKENYHEHIDIRYIEKMSDTKATIQLTEKSHWSWKYEMIQNKHSMKL
jgi:two-component system, OmpR family, sensor histidine kinase VicK